MECILQNKNSAVGLFGGTVCFVCKVWVPKSILKKSLCGQFVKTTAHGDDRKSLVWNQTPCVVLAVLYLPVYNLFGSLTCSFRLLNATRPHCNPPHITFDFISILQSLFRFPSTAKFGSDRRGGRSHCCYRARRGPPRSHQQLPLQCRKWAGHPLQWHSCAWEPPCCFGLPDHHQRWQVQHLQEYWTVRDLLSHFIQFIPLCFGFGKKNQAHLDFSFHCYYCK